MLGSIFKAEIVQWFRIYTVRKRDMQTMKKESAIKRGHEFRMFHWNDFPSTICKLQELDYVTDTTITNCKRSISYHLKEIKNNRNQDIKAEVEVIRKYMLKYDLIEYVDYKIDFLFKNTDIGVELKRNIFNDNY